MSFLNVHKRNILERIPINKRQITPGDIVLFRYKGKEGISEKIVLCLGGLAGKFATEDKLTAIDLTIMRTAPLEVSYMTLFFSAAKELEEPIQIILLLFRSFEICFTNS